MDLIKTKNTDIAADIINGLHANALGVAIVAATDIVNAFADVGEALSKQKEKMAHGEWTPWVKDNLKFGVKQAAKYMRVFKNKNELLSSGESSMNNALAQIAVSNTVSEIDTPEEDERTTQIEKLKKELSAARTLIEELQADDPHSEYQQLYADALAELEELKRQGEEPDDNIVAEIDRLKKMREKVRKDVGGLVNIGDRFIKTREFFSKEIALIPTLNLSESIIKTTRGDAEALIQVMESWITSMKGKYSI